ncbi:MAG: aminotransferase [Acidimicrobiales bacterium]
MEFAARVSELEHSPIGEAHALVPKRSAHHPLLDLSQAAPSFPPPGVVAERIAEVAYEADGARYAPQVGLTVLRDAFAADLSSDYRSSIHQENVLVTAGCNQAFCLVASALTTPGDSVVLVSPHYFNHDMWLNLEGVEVRHMRCGADMLPDPADLPELVDDGTRAVVLVTPGNPTGVTVPAEIIAALADQCRSFGLVLVIDEKYRSYRADAGPAHHLFEMPDWEDHVVSLHSFSKDFAIPGYRVGAIVGGPDLVVEALKILDCVAICAPRIGQEAAAAGLLHAQGWRREQVVRIASLQQRFEKVMAERPGGYEVVSAGAYFGWVRHPFPNIPTPDVVAGLILDRDVLVIPGTAFTPDDSQMLRMSFANLSIDELNQLPDRLAP